MAHTHPLASGAAIHGAPFTSCALPNAFGEQFIEQLESELGQLDFKLRDNDLYSFHQARAEQGRRSPAQTSDLKTSTLPSITALR
jgi:hypothetical protein